METNINNQENEFHPWSSQEEKDFEYSIMDEYYNEMRIEDVKNEAITNKIMNALEKIKSKEWMEDLKLCAIESETHNPFKIVKKPKGNYQKENELENLEGVWVDQSGGYPIEDSFYGTITVKIGERRYLEMPFSC